jgi:hypothetical protein
VGAEFSGFTTGGTTGGITAPPELRKLPLGFVPGFVPDVPPVADPVAEFRSAELAGGFAAFPDSAGAFCACEPTGCDPCVWLGTSDDGGGVSGFVSCCAGAGTVGRFSPDIDCPSWIKMLPMSWRKLYASAPKITASAIAIMLPAAARLKCGESGGEVILARSQACSNESSSGGIKGHCAGAWLSGGLDEAPRNGDVAGKAGASRVTVWFGESVAGVTAGLLCILAVLGGFKNADDAAAGFSGLGSPA